MTRIILVAMSAIFVLSCSTTPNISRNPAIASDYVPDPKPVPEVPSADDLFEHGVFSIPPQHPFDFNHLNQQVDLSKRRPAYNLSGTVFDKKYGRRDSTLYGNFYHKGKFYIVRVPNDGVEKLFQIVSWFPPVINGHEIAAHTFLRFQMRADRPIEIISEMPTPDRLEELRSMSSSEERLRALPEEMSGPSAHITNVAVSAEAQGVKNSKRPDYDFVDGQRGEYLIVGRFMSMRERLLEFYRTGNPSEQYEIRQKNRNLNLDLMNALQFSQDVGLKHIYVTLTFNCATFACDVLGENPKTYVRRKNAVVDYLRSNMPMFLAPGIKENFAGVQIEQVGLDPSLRTDARDAFQEATNSGVNNPCVGLSEIQCRRLRKSMLEVISSSSEHKQLSCPMLFGGQ